MTDRQHENPFEGLMPTPAPAGLKARVLEAARRGGETALPRQTVVDRIWENRWLRPVWAVTVAALVALYDMYETPVYRMAAMEDMLTMAPPPCFSMYGKTYLHVRN